jgi:hypothetical protein
MNSGEGAPFLALDERVCSRLPRHGRSGTANTLFHRLLHVVTGAWQDEACSHLASLNLIPGASTNGSYFLKLHDPHSTLRSLKVAVLKPSDEEAHAINNPRGFASAADEAETALPSIRMKQGILPGEGAFRECAAFLLDRGGFSGVPPTVPVLVRHKSLHVSAAFEARSEAAATAPSSVMNSPSLSVATDLRSISPMLLLPQPDGPMPDPPQLVSLRKGSAESFATDGSSCMSTASMENEAAAFLPHQIDAAEAAAKLLRPPVKRASLQLFVPSACSAEAVGSNVWPVDEVHKIAILDIRICNSDRNEDNILARAWKSTPVQPSERLSESEAASAVDFEDSYISSSSEYDEEYSFDDYDVNAFLKGKKASIAHQLRIRPVAHSATEGGAGARRRQLKHPSAAAAVSQYSGIDDVAEEGKAAEHLPLADIWNAALRKALPDSALACKATNSLVCSQSVELLTKRVSSPRSASTSGPVVPSAPSAMMTPIHMSLQPPREVVQFAPFEHGIPPSPLMRPSAELPLLPPPSGLVRTASMREADTFVGRSIFGGSVFAKTTDEGKKPNDASQPSAADAAAAAQVEPAASKPAPWRSARLQARLSSEGQAPPPLELESASSAALPLSKGSLSGSPPLHPHRPTLSSRSSEGNGIMPSPMIFPRSEALSARGSSAVGGAAEQTSILLANIDPLDGTLRSAARSDEEDEEDEVDIRALRKASHIELVPLDHGLALPSINQLDDIQLAWTNWKQTREPLSQTSRAYVEALDGRGDTVLLASVLGDRIRPACLLTLRLCTALLQEGVSAGLTLMEIGLMMCRESGLGRIGTVQLPAENELPSKRAHKRKSSSSAQADLGQSKRSRKSRRNRRRLDSETSEPGSQQLQQAPLHPLPMTARQIERLNPSALEQAVRKARDQIKRAKKREQRSQSSEEVGAQSAHQQAFAVSPLFQPKKATWNVVTKGANKTKQQRPQGRSAGGSVSSTPVLSASNSAADALQMSPMRLGTHTTATLSPLLGSTRSAGAAYDDPPWLSYHDAVEEAFRRIIRQHIEVILANRERTSGTFIGRF